MQMTKRALVAMRNPGFYPHAPAEVEVIETHVSTVFIAGERVYKVKKALKLPFLDYSTLGRRRHFCEEEVRLNRRFAPDVYLGVRSIVERPRGFVLGEADDPAAVEYAVEMSRLSEERTLERLLRTGEAGEPEIELVARKIADLHHAAKHAPASRGGPADIKAQLSESFETVRAHVGALVEKSTIEPLQQFCSAFLLAREQLLEARVRAGCVRDCHGDLRAEHIVLDGDRVSLFDCIEFDERLRMIDVACDLAFLVMDLEHLGAGSLAGTLERAYVERTGDAQLCELLPFYCCYRALVRGKIACVRHEQLSPRDARRGDLAHEARALFALSQRFSWRARLPLALVICGTAASGKSVLAVELAKRSGFAHISSDLVRKELAGLRADERGGAEIYAPALTTRTYAEIARRARAELEAGRGAILDATYLERRLRLALLGDLEATRARVLFCECQAPPVVLRERAAGRARTPEHGSDATPEVVDRQLESFEPLTEVPARDYLAVRGDRPVADAAEAVDSFATRAVFAAPTS
jgi:aminoglycoside phosphotransferase family enzyme/predicted kinase